MFRVSAPTRTEGGSRGRDPVNASHKGHVGVVISKAIPATPDTYSDTCPCLALDTQEGKFHFASFKSLVIVKSYPPDTVAFDPRARPE